MIHTFTFIRATRPNSLFCHYDIWVLQLSLIGCFFLPNQNLMIINMVSRCFICMQMRDWIYVVDFMLWNMWLIYYFGTNVRTFLNWLFWWLVLLTRPPYFCLNLLIFIWLTVFTQPKIHNHLCIFYFRITIHKYWM